VHHLTQLSSIPVWVLRLRENGSAKPGVGRRERKLITRYIDCPSFLDYQFISLSTERRYPRRWWNCAITRRREHVFDRYRFFAPSLPERRSKSQNKEINPMGETNTSMQCVRRVRNVVSETPDWNDLPIPHDENRLKVSILYPVFT
jgi:hypothetical protein